LAELRAAGLDIDTRTTTARGDGERIARDAYREGCRDFIAVGGDGTTYELINGIFSPEGGAGALPVIEEGERPNLGFLPMGTGNSFLRDFSEHGAAHAITSLTGGARRDCDLVRVHHRAGVLHFINIFSIGFVADVAALRNNRFAALGEFGYVVAVVARVLGLAPSRFPMALDGGPMDQAKSTFISINNSTFTGGKMIMAPDADPSDGLIDVIRVGAMSRGTLLATFPKIFKGTHVHHPAVTAATAREIVLELDGELDVMIDGELLRIHPTRLEVIPKALQVIA
jgi:YegS/Rv2252/BmrU family lipid kinase